MISYMDILLRFGLAMLIGIAIGLQRERTQHPAGLRTHMLVALSSCVVMATGQLLMVTMSRYGGSFDPARMACQVIPGIGFLGAGSIIHQHGNTRGITTAAGLWATACAGMCAGAGFYALAILGTIGILLILSVLKDARTTPGSVLHTSLAEVKLTTHAAEEASVIIRRLAHRYDGEATRIVRKTNDEVESSAGETALVAYLRFTGLERDRNMEKFSFDLSTALTASDLEITMIKK